MRTSVKITVLAVAVVLAIYSGFAIGDAPGSPRDLARVLWLLLTKGW